MILVLRLLRPFRPRFTECPSCRFKVTSRSAMFTDGTIWSWNIEGSRETRKRKLVKTLQLQRGGKLANSGREGNGRRLSLSFLCPAHRVQTCRWRRGGGSAVFSRTSFLCVGLIGAEWGKESTIQLAVSTKHPSLQNTHTHTPSGNDPALNFLPGSQRGGEKRKKGNFWRWKAPDNYSLLVSRSDNHEMRHEVVWGEKGTVRKLDWDHPRCSLRTKIKGLEDLTCPRTFISCATTKKPKKRHISLRCCFSLQLLLIPFLNYVIPVQSIADIPWRCTNQMTRSCTFAHIRSEWTFANEPRREAQTGPI